MKYTTTLRRAGVTTAALMLTFGLAACGSDDDSADDATSADTTMAQTTDAPATDSPDDVDYGAQTFGAGCAAVPADGLGSFNGMATDPVATAASNNPALSTLVQAVTAAGLGDTLNSAEALTVFAPTNDAFAAIPADTLAGVLADKELLTKILTYHVVAGKLSPDEIAGKLTTLEGDTLGVKGSGESFVVGAGKANIVCGNVPTANATVYLIDQVLMPPM